MVTIMTSNLTFFLTKVVFETQKLVFTSSIFQPGGKNMYIYIYTNCFQKTIGSKIAISTMPRDVERILTANALYVFLPCVTPKQVSDWPLLLQCRGFGNKEFFQKIVAKKSWRALLLLVRWFGEQGFIHPIPSY